DHCNDEDQDECSDPEVRRALFRFVFHRSPPLSLALEQTELWILIIALSGIFFNPKEQEGWKVHEERYSCSLFVNLFREL
ncbi:hypothetical protein, partial [Bacillus licheniformis]|uniref:hypothetical protein n=1 Tax=Bacillus licheniformis TaxID=1402 RepID=UPI001C8B09FC